MVEGDRKNYDTIVNKNFEFIQKSFTAVDEQIFYNIINNNTYYRYFDSLTESNKKVFIKRINDVFISDYLKQPLYKDYIKKNKNKKRNGGTRKPRNPAKKTIKNIPSKRRHTKRKNRRHKTYKR
jgi:hypothetical protein